MGGLLHGIRRGLLAGQGNRYLLDDEFRDTLAAGAVNGTAAIPGPGTRAVTDTNSKLTVGSGVANFATGGGGLDDPRLSYGTIARASGRVLIAKLNVDTEGAIVAMSDVNTATRQSAIRLYDTSIAIDLGAASWLAVGAYVVSTDYRVAIVELAAGEYVLIKGGAFENWELLWRDTNGATASLYPIVGADDNASVFTVDWIRVPYQTWLPTPIAYDSFTRANGAIGSSEGLGPDNQPCSPRVWTGATWTVSGNEAINTPTGTERGTDLSLEANYTAGLCDTLVALGFENVAQSATVHSGSKAQQVQATALGGGVYYQAPGGSFNLGDWYSFSVWGNRLVNVGGSNMALQVYNGSALVNGALIDAGVYTQYFLTGRVMGVVAQPQARLAVEISGGGLPGDTDVVDDFSFLQLTLSTLFSSVVAATADVVVSVELDTIYNPDYVFGLFGTQAGLVVNLDDAATPANFVIAYHDGVNCRLEKCVAGTYTSVISAAAAYAAGATLVVVKEGTTYRLYYNNAQVGATSTISDAGIVSNTLHGMFSTYAGNQLDNFQLMPRGTGNEYAKLDQWSRALP